MAHTWVGSNSAWEVVGLCCKQDVPVTLLGLQGGRPAFPYPQYGLCLGAPEARSDSLPLQPFFRQLTERIDI